MKRYNQLTFWEKIGFWGSIASIIGLIGFLITSPDIKEAIKRLVEGDKREPEVILQEPANHKEANNQEDADAGTPEPDLEVPEPKAALLIVRSNVPNDTLYINNEPKGPTGPEANKLPPGRHTVRVEKQGYKPWKRTLALISGEEKTIRAELFPLIGLTPGNNRPGNNRVLNNLNLANTSYHAGNGLYAWTAYITGSRQYLSKIRSVRYEFYDPYSSYLHHTQEGDVSREGHPVSGQHYWTKIKLRATVTLLSGESRVYSHRLSLK